jgi:hypothetical protein
MKNINYTPEMTQQIIETYLADPTISTVEKLAEEHSRTKKSIIGKLSREGVYQKSSYTTKTGDKPITKLEIVAQIADALNLESDEIAGLEKTPKLVLALVRDSLQKM